MVGSLGLGLQRVSVFSMWYDVSSGLFLDQYHCVEVGSSVPNFFSFVYYLFCKRCYVSLGPFCIC